MKKLKELFSNVGKKIHGAVVGTVKCVKNVVTSIKWLEVPVATYVRWILAIILSVNTVLTYLGLNPIKVSENELYEIVTVVLNVVVLIINTYKNNSTSKEALISDQIMRALKAAITSKEDTAIEKLYDILEELNGQEFIPEDHTNDEHPSIDTKEDVISTEDEEESTDDQSEETDIKGEDAEPVEETEKETIDIGNGNISFTPKGETNSDEFSDAEPVEEEPTVEG